MVIKTVYHFVDSNLGVKICSKRKRLTEKEGGVLKVVLPKRWADDLPWGRKGLPWGTWVGGNYTD